MCPVMLQYLKIILRVGQIMRYKVLQFWAKLDTNHPFTRKGDFFEKLTDINLVYFIYPITILQSLKKSLKWITKYKVRNFWTNWPTVFFWGKLTIVTFVNLLYSIILKSLK